MEGRSNSGHRKEKERESGGRDQKFRGIAVKIFRDGEALLCFFG